MFIKTYCYGWYGWYGESEKVNIQPMEIRKQGKMCSKEIVSKGVKGTQEESYSVNESQ